MSGRTWSTEAAAGSDDGNDDGNPPRQEGNNDADRAEENIAPAPNQTNSIFYQCSFSFTLLIAPQILVVIFEGEGD